MELAKYIQDEYVLEKFLSSSFTIDFRQFNRKYRKAEKSNNSFLYVDIAFAASVIGISISVLSNLTYIYTYVYIRKFI